MDWAGSWTGRALGTGPFVTMEPSLRDFAAEVVPLETSHPCEALVKTFDQTGTEARRRT